MPLQQARLYFSTQQFRKHLLTLGAIPLEGERTVGKEDAGAGALLAQPRDGRAAAIRPAPKPRPHRRASWCRSSRLRSLRRIIDGFAQDLDIHEVIENSLFQDRR